MQRKTLVGPTAGLSELRTLEGMHDLMFSLDEGDMLPDSEDCPTGIAQKAVGLFIALAIPC